MKKVISPALAGIFLAALVSCSQEDYKSNVQGLRTYVDSVSGLDWSDQGRKWEDIDVAYQARLQELEKDTAYFDETLRADYDRIKSDYENLRIRYNEQQAQLYRTQLRNALFGDGMMGNDMNYNFVTPENAVVVYERFITVVDSNGHTYTPADWEEINLLYNGLEGRKVALTLDADDLKKIEKTEGRWDEIKDRYKDMKDVAKDVKDETKDLADDIDDK